MKKLVLCAMVIVAIISTNSAMAQQFPGHGMSKIPVQRETDSATTVAYFEKGIFGTNQEALSVYNHFTYVSGQDIANGITQDIADQMGEPFFPNQRDNYKIDYYTIRMGTEEWADFCKNNDDGYILDRPGQLKFEFGDPSKSWVSEHKSERIIATITSLATGKTARLFADCFNPIHPASKEFATKRVASTTRSFQPSMGSNVNTNTNDIRININPMPRYTPPVNPGFYKKPEPKSWFSKNAGWFIPVVAVVGGIGGYELCHGNHDAVHGGDNTYDNGFQGGSGSSGVSGGTGGQQTFNSLALRTATLNRFAPKGVSRKFTFSYSIVRF